MDLANLCDPLSAAIVVGGTLTATVLRCGWRDAAVAAGTLGALPRRRFDAERARARLAELVRGARQDGLLRARTQSTGDAELDAAVGELLARRALPALAEASGRLRAGRLARDARAARTLAQGAELAPVFGLAGTLISLNQLRAGIDHADFGAAIAMAVLTTLYGLLLANIVLAPLARLVERACEHEDRARAEVMDWLAAQLAPAPPPAREPRVTAVS